MKNFNIKKYIKKIKESIRKLTGFVMKNKLSFSFLGIFVLCILILFISNSFAASVPVKSVEIKSLTLNYDEGEAGSWKITKSAEWTGKGKARITFDVDTTKKIKSTKTDVIFVIDTSESMSVLDIRSISLAIKNTLDNLNGNAALISFNDEATILSDFTSDLDPIYTMASKLITSGGTNYYKALMKADELLENYEYDGERHVSLIFLTDGYPSAGVPNEALKYQELKSKYSYLNINAIQYNMGNTFADIVEDVSDTVYMASAGDVKDAMYKATFDIESYSSFSVTDTVNTKYFTIDRTNAELGSINIVDNQVILTRDNLLSGRKFKFYIDISLKSSYQNTIDLFETNTGVVVNSEIDGIGENVTSSLTPILSSGYTVTYDVNAPSDCIVSNVPASGKKIVFSTVTLSNSVPVCSGYQFKGWKIVTKGLNKINDDNFIMPEEDITIKGTWSKVGLKKTTDGEVYEGATLYKVIEEAASQGEFASDYPEDTHQDSVDGTGTKNIYYYAGHSVGSDLLDKNNVVFAGMCWQMIRTTDTGGVKLLYNGEVNSDGSCSENRYTHAGYTYYSVENIDGDFYYSDDYTYDPDRQDFTLAGNTFVGSWSDDTYEQLLGKYTCMMPNEGDTCQILYYVDKYEDEFDAYVYGIDGYANYSTIGTVPFNVYDDSLAYAGYMYNDVYEFGTKKAGYREILKSATLSTSYWYADGVTYNSTTQKYTLNNPYKISSSSSYSSLRKKYTFGSTSSTTTSSTARYITNVSSSTYYYRTLSLGQNDTSLTSLLSTRYYSSSYTINSSGFYELSNPSQFQFNDWFSIYSSLKGKYISVENPDQDIGYMVSTDRYGYYYNSTGETYFKFYPSFSYTNGRYSLSGTESTFWEWSTDNLNSLRNSHYTCFGLIDGCTNASYIYAGNNTELFYITLSNGESIGTAINKMLYADNVNTKDSTIKKAIDIWYERYLSNYTKYLENAVFCNARAIDSLGGWDPDSGLVTSVLSLYGDPFDGDLSCENVTDRFSVSNPKAKLTYPVGLLTVTEAFLLNGSSFQMPDDFYLMTPAQVYSTDGSSHVDIIYIDSRGDIQVELGSVSKGVRPVISLKAGTTYVSGNGSMDSPYVVETN